MLLQEREVVANEAIKRMGQVIGPSDNIFFDETLKAKFVLVLEALDRVASSANRPLLVTDIFPGYDLLIAGLQSTGFSEFIPKLGHDIRAGVGIDPLVLDTMRLVLDDEFGSAKGALLYEADDGSKYVAFQSKHREETLRSVGITHDEELMAQISPDKVLS